MRKGLAVLTVLVSVAACEPQREEADPGRTPLQEEAARRACIAEELVRVADDEIDTIEASLPADIESSAQSQVVWQAQLSALQFAQVLRDHALLRRAALSHADSALNHSRSAQDSTRHMQTAESYASLQPEPNTLEANVANEYERRFARIRSDEDHRCNWDL